jgi:hypothetical protein
MTRQLSRQVAHIVINENRPTINDVAPCLPRVARADLVRALRDANGYGYLRMIRKGRGPNHPAVYGPGGVPLESLPRVASVWELAAPRPTASWPESSGTVYRLLGEEEEEAA